MALVLAVAIMSVLFISGSALVYFATANTRASDYEQRSSSTYHVAEGGIALAVSVLASSSTPLDPSLLPATNSTTESGTVTYGGTLSGTTWTITAAASVHNPSGDTSLANTLTRTVEVENIIAGGLGTSWGRIYVDTVSGCTRLKKLVIPVPFTARGCVTMDGSPAEPTQLTGSPVSVGGDVTLNDSDSIGVSGTPIEQADIAGTCKLGSAAAHTPCSAIDNVFANTITTSPTDLARPTIDWAHWYDNAMPGPNQNCTVGALPPGKVFDDNAIWDNSATSMDLTPAGSSYTCQVWQAGELVGEISWNHATSVLKVKGTIFFDGAVEIRDDAAIVNYQGKATLYGSGTWHSDELLCAGGDGTNDCRADIADWDPTQNLLILIMGGKEAGSAETIKFHKNGGGFQGVVYGTRKCTLDDDVKISAPILCDQLSVKEDADGTTIWPWPASLTSRLPGQVNASPTTDFQLILGEQH